jgi:nucleoid DNA-binding protein
MSRIQGVFSDTEDLSRAWIALGTYISNCLRTGKAVHIHKFGTFTFTSP